MVLAVILLMDEDRSLEATAYAHDAEGRLLPPGLWRVVCECGGGYGTLAVENMPEHWRAQIELGGEIGKKLSREGLG